MIQTIIFDVDGIVLDREMYFSDRYAKDFGVPVSDLLLFFKGPFQKCLVGKGDLKEELVPFLNLWKWEGSVDELLAYWFGHESTLIETTLDYIIAIRKKGTLCYLCTDADQYRVQYMLSDLGLEEKFDGIFASSLVGHIKEEEVFWQHAYERLGGPNKGSVLVLDDEEENVAAAERFGFVAEYIQSEHQLATTLNAL